MTGSVLMLISALLVYATSLVTYRFVRGQWTILSQPVTWFYLSWLVGLAMLSLPLFEYYESFSVESGAYVLAVLLVFSLGTVIATLVGPRTHRSPESNVGRLADNPPMRLIGLLLLAGIGGTIMLIANAILSGGLSVGERLDLGNAAAVRLDHMDGGDSRIGLLYGPANMASSLGGLGLAMAMYVVGARITRARRPLVIGIGILLGLNAIGALFAFGSRMFAVFAVVVAFLGFVQGRWSIGERVLVSRMGLRGYLLVGMAAMLTLVALWFSSTYFLEKRVAETSPTALLYRTHRALLSPEAHEISYRNKPLQYLLFSMSYATTPVATLTYYLDLPENRMPGPYYGEYNFPAIARWIRRFTFSGNPFSWELARYEIFKPLADISFGTNVWSTIVRDLIADFGKIGALIFVMALGYFSQRLTDTQATNPSVKRGVTLVYVQLILLFSGFISLFFMPQIHWPLYAAIVLLAFGRKSSIRSA